jgi:hypothetical protein
VRTIYKEFQDENKGRREGVEMSILKNQKRVHSGY